MSSDTPPSANAIILAGGDGTRLGEDKALVPLAGIPLMTRTARRLHHVSQLIILAGRSYLPVDIGLSTNLTFAPDVITAGGPLVGIYSGLLASNAELNVVVACDMPFVRPRLLAHLLAAAIQSEAPVEVPQWNGKPQVLPSVCRRSAIDVVHQAIDDGERSLRGFIDHVQAHVVPEAQVRDLDPEGRSFFNINTRDDLQAAAQMLAERP